VDALLVEPICHGPATLARPRGLVVDQAVRWPVFAPAVSDYDVAFCDEGRAVVGDDELRPGASFGKPSGEVMVEVVDLGALPGNAVSDGDTTRARDAESVFSSQAGSGKIRPALREAA
jgi:hypothetical protein